MLDNKEKLVSIVVSLLWFIGLVMATAHTVSAKDSALDQIPRFDKFHYSYYLGKWKRLPNFSQLTPVRTGYSATIDLDDRPKDSYFGAVFVGQFKIETAGNYTFYTTSDDGSKLIIDGRPVVDNDDTHASKTKSGTEFMSAGYHQIRVEFFQRKSGKKLQVHYQGADTDNSKQTLSSPTLELEAGPPQFHYAYYSGKWKRLPNFSKLTPIHTGYSATINLDDRPKDHYFGTVFVGQLKIDTAGDYRFYTTSDDGSKLIIDGQPVVDNDDTHASKTKNGTVFLSAGYHQIRVEFFQRRGGKKLEVHYQGPDTDQRQQMLRPSSICFCADTSQIEYQYDELSRLTSVLIPKNDLNIGYVYDAMGNRLARHSDAVSDQTLKNHSFSIVQPTNLQALSFDDVTLSWVHQAPADGHFYYEIYFSDTNPPDLYTSGLTQQSLHIGAVESSLRQFLQIKAIDRRGNETTSPIWVLSPLDTDSDNIPDHIENTLCVDAQNADTDNDGLLDGLEDKPIFGMITPQETDPCNPDSDGDLMPDGWETQNGLNPLDASDAGSDKDEDGFSAIEEYRSETDPNSAESMPSGILINFEETDLPNSLQWINEGNQPWTLDRSEPLEGGQSLKSGAISHNQNSRMIVPIISTGGLVRFNLRVSSENGYDYLGFYVDDQLLQQWSGTVETTVSFNLPVGYHALEWRYHKDGSTNDGGDAVWIDQLFISTQENVDSDADGIDDPWEWWYFDNLDTDPSFDTDGDGLTHLQEYQVGTAPDNSDTDNDLIPDGWEVDNGLNPLDSTDANGDINDNGQSNFVEYALSIPTQSANMDSDEDRMPDLWEARRGLNPLDTSDASSDKDGDGFSAIEEYRSETDPNSAESMPSGILINFEETDLPNSLQWINEGNQPWALDRSEPLEGGQSLKSGAISHGQNSRMIVPIISTGGLVRFNLKVSSENDYDYLRFYLDDQLLQRWSGTVETTVSFDLPAGYHLLQWRYHKDGGVNRGKDAAWIDQLFISTEEDSDADGAMDSWELRYFGHLDEDLSQDSDGDSLTHLQESQAGTAPDNGDTDNDLIPDGWETQNGLNPLDASDASSDKDEDGFSAIEEYRSETDPNSAESMSSGILINFEETDLPDSLQWINEGDQPWALDRSEPIEGGQSLKSGAISHNQNSRMIVPIISTGGLVRFNLKVSSENGNDYLGFYVDDQLLQQWSGTVETTVSFNLPVGYHALEWRYHKDGGTNDGGDAAWIDQLFISAEENSQNDENSENDVIYSLQLNQSESPRIKFIATHHQNKKMHALLAPTHTSITDRSDKLTFVGNRPSYLTYAHITHARNSIYFQPLNFTDIYKFNGFKAQ